MRRIGVFMVLVGLTAGSAAAQEEAPKTRTVRTIAVKARFLSGEKALLQKRGLIEDAPWKTISAKDADKIVDAMREAEDAFVLHAPALKLHDGQRAYIAITKQQNYVLDCPLDDDGEPKPVIGTLQVGLILDLKPSITEKGEIVFTYLAPRSSVLLGTRECKAHVKTDGRIQEVTWQEPVLWVGGPRFENPCDISVKPGQALVVPLTYRIEQGGATVRARVIDGKVEEKYEPKRRRDDSPGTDLDVVCIFTAEEGEPVEIPEGQEVPDFEGPTFELQTGEPKGKGAGLFGDEEEE